MTPKMAYPSMVLGNFQRTLAGGPKVHQSVQSAARKERTADLIAKVGPTCFRLMWQPTVRRLAAKLMGLHKALVVS